VSIQARPFIFVCSVSCLTPASALSAAAISMYRSGAFCPRALGSALLSLPHASYRGR
jgi:hypothetical protein